MRRVPMRRARERARFIAETAIAEGVHIAIVGDPRSPAVFVWSPTAAPTPERQLACERSFKRAVYQNIRVLSLYAATPRGRA